MTEHKRLFPFRPWKEISNLQELLDTSDLVVQTILEEHEENVRRMRLKDKIITGCMDYVDEAQVIIQGSKLKGAPALFRLGEKLQARERGEDV